MLRSGFPKSLVRLDPQTGRVVACSRQDDQISHRDMKPSIACWVVVCLGGHPDLIAELDRKKFLSAPESMRFEGTEVQAREWFGTWKKNWQDKLNLLQAMKKAPD